MNTTTTKNIEDNRRFKLAKFIAKVYLVGALSISFDHFIHAFNKLGLYGFGAMSMPIAIDGLAIFGVLLQHKSFAQETRTIGRWMQLICGSLSLVVNIFSGWGSPGAMIQGATWVTIYMMLELIVARIRPASMDAQQAAAEAEAKAAAALAAANAWKVICNHPTACETAAQCDRKTIAKNKAAKTRKATAKTRKLQEQALEQLVGNVTTHPDVKVMRAA